MQSSKTTFIKTYCFILSNVFFFVYVDKKKQKQRIACCVARKCCPNAQLFLAFRFINNIIEEKRPEIKSSKASVDYRERNVTESKNCEWKEPSRLRKTFLVIELKSEIQIAVYKYFCKHLC